VGIYKPGIRKQNIDFTKKILTLEKF